MPLVERTWHGDEVQRRIDRATGRAVIGMGEQTAAAQASVAHVQSGDLKRSIHQAKVGTMGEVGTDAETVEARRHFFQTEVGSWLPYACVENNRGGAHRFADIGWELAKPTFDPTLERAFREEGL